MNNNLTGLFQLCPNLFTPEDAARSMNIPLSKIIEYKNNPQLPIPNSEAAAFAEYFSVNSDLKVDPKLVQGYPFRRKIEIHNLSNDKKQDICRESGSLREVLIYKYCEGYYENTDTYFKKNTGFIAQSFDFSKKNIRNIFNSFKLAIADAGYTPIAANEIVSNNYITSDIFDAIDNCDFLVMDTTFENHGAYFEAGYAKGIGKPLIICCKKSVFDKRKDHFDINQIRHVLWSSPEELTKLLTDRILQTVVTGIDPTSK